MLELAAQLTRGRPPRRRDRRRPDRHRDRGDAGGPPLRDAGRHARPPARPLPAAPVGRRRWRRSTGSACRFVGGAQITEVVGNGAGHVVRTSTHGDLPCDVVVSAAGFRTSLPGDARAGRPRAHRRRRRHAPRPGPRPACSRAATCIAFPHPRYGRLAIPHWDNALHSGRQAADGVLNIGEAVRPRPVLLLRHRPARGSSRSASPPTPSSGRRGRPADRPRRRRPHHRGRCS